MMPFEGDGGASCKESPLEGQAARRGGESQSLSVGLRGEGRRDSLVCPSARPSCPPDRDPWKREPWES